MLFSLQSAEVVQTWQEFDLNTELGLEPGTSWSAVFDSSKTVNKLLLHTHTLSGYKLVEFNPEGEMVRPRTIRSGHMVEGIVGLVLPCQNVWEEEEVEGESGPRDNSAIQAGSVGRVRGGGSYDSGGSKEERVGSVLRQRR